MNIELNQKKIYNRDMTIEFNYILKTFFFFSKNKIMIIFYFMTIISRQFKN